jgi:ferritin-like metal-binding protein YciE
MPGMQSPQDLLGMELKSIHSAEKQLSRAIPKLGKLASSESVRKMLERRLEEGKRLTNEVEDALEEIETTKKRPKNTVVEALLEDINQHVDEIEDENMLDAALIGEVQKLEHYCIAAWGTSASLGRLLEQPKIVKSMERALKEGKQFDQELTQLAEQEINPKMLEGQGLEDEDEEPDEGEDEEEDEDEE